MSEAKTIEWLILCIVVVFGASGLARFFGLTHPAWTFIVLLPALLLSYPIIKQWKGSDSGLTFKWWALQMLFISAVATLLMLMFG